MNTEAPELAGLLAREHAIRQETEILRDANIALTQNLSLERVLETLLDYLAKLVPYDSANVMLWMPIRDSSSAHSDVTRVIKTSRTRGRSFSTDRKTRCCNGSIQRNKASSYLTRFRSLDGSSVPAPTTCVTGWVYRS